MAFVLKLSLVPLTGAGAPFVLFFAAVLVSSLLVGVGPGLCAVVLSMRSGAYSFMMRSGYVLFAGDGIVVCDVTLLCRYAQDTIRETILQLVIANECIR